MAATNVQAFSGDVEISSNLAVSGSKFTYDNTNTTVFTGTTSAAANEIGYLDMSTSSSSNNIHVKIYIKYGQSSALGDAEYSFYIRPNSANFSLIYDYRNQNGPITPVVYRTNATDLYSGGTPGVVRFGYSIATAQNVIWRVEVQQRSNNATFYPTNTGSAVDTTGLVQVTPAPFTRFDSNVAVNVDNLFVDTVNSRVGIGTTNPVGVNGGNRLEGSSTTGFEYIATRDDTTSSAGDFIGAYLFKNTDTSGAEPHYAGIAAKDPATFGRMDLHFYTGRDNYENDTPQMTIDEDGNVDTTGTLTATNLIRGVAEEAVRWNSQSETVFPQSATTRYYKLATLGTTGDGSNGGKLRISGTIGGFTESSTTLIDAFVASRGGIRFGGTLSGYGGDGTTATDIVVYLESDGTFAVWLKLLRFHTFDFTIMGAQVSNNTRECAVLPCPTTDTSVTTPTGTLQGSVVDSCSVVFTDDGNVGVGTTNPLAAFEVQAADMDGAASGTSQVISRFSSGDDGVLNVFAVATGNGEETLGLQTQIDGRAFETDVSGGWVYGTDSRYDLSLQPYKGRVGIGTTNPFSGLHVHGSDANQNAAPDTSSSTAGHMLLRNTKTGSSPYSMVLGVDQTTGIGFLNAAGNSDIQPICINTRGGNVGIGTTNARHALDVKKDITTGSSTTTHLQTHFNIGNKTFTGGNALMGYSGRNANNLINAATYWKSTGGYYGTDGYFGIAVNDNSTGGSDAKGITEGELESQTHIAIKTNGNVGIGHTNPLMTLDVNGPMQSWTGRHVKTVPVRHNSYNDIASNGGTLRIGNEVVGGSAGYSGSFCAFDWFGSYSIKNFSGDRWVTPSRIRICFRWAFVAGYVDNVTFKIWETLYTTGNSLKATFTSSNGSLSRGYTTVWGPDMTMIRNDVPGLMIEADSNTTDNASATVRIADIWLEYVKI